MARILLTILFIIALRENVSSQLIDSVYQGLDIIRSIRQIDSSTFIMVTDDSKIHALDLNGRITWTKDIAPGVGQNKYVQSLFQAFPDQRDSFFYITTIDNHCDYFEDLRLFKLDFSGEVIDIHLFPDFTWLSGRIIYPESVNGPEFILYSYTDIYIQYPNDSTVIIPLNYPIEKLEVNDAGDFAVLTREQIYYYTKNSTGFSLSNSIEIEYFPHLFFDFYFSQDNKLIWSNEKQLFTFNSNLDTLNIFSPLAGEKILLSKESDTNFVLITQDINEELNFFLLDQQLNTLMDQHIALSDHYFTDLAWSADSILTVAGMEYYREDKGYPFVRQFNFSAFGNESGYNAGISNLKRDSLIDRGISECFFEELHYYDVHNIKIDIANKGNSTIHTMTITPLKSYCGWWCHPQPLHFIYLENMNLQPGETKEFSLDYIAIGVDRFEPTVELCLLAILPDQHVDIDHADNIYCFGLTVGISNEADIMPLTFYPNPVTDKLYISSKADLIELVLYNSEGKMVFKQDGIENGEVDVSSLAPGLFFIQYLTKHGSVYTDRFVKL